MITLGQVYNSWVNKAEVDAKFNLRNKVLKFNWVSEHNRSKTSVDSVHMRNSTNTFYI